MDTLSGKAHTGIILVRSKINGKAQHEISPKAFPAQVESIFAGISFAELKQIVHVMTPSFTAGEINPDIFPNIWNYVIISEHDSLVSLSDLPEVGAAIKRGIAGVDETSAYLGEEIHVGIADAAVGEATKQHGWNVLSRLRGLFSYNQ